METHWLNLTIFFFRLRGGIIFSYFLCFYIEENLLYLRIFVFGYEYSFRFIERERSSAALCGPPISFEAEVNYPFWLATEVQASQCVG